jgi:DNA-directed RNA polymerase specialized sigma24 family protein
MFDQPPELSPDLEWMLQSGQASREMLAEELVQDYYLPLYRLGLALYSETNKARAFAQETLSQALLETHRFHGRTSIQTWLYRIAQGISRKYRGDRFWERSLFDLHRGQGPPRDGAQGMDYETKDPLDQIRDALGDDRHFALGLYYLLDQKPAQVAAVLKTSEGVVQSWLGKARHIYRSCSWSNDLDDYEADRRIKRLLQGDRQGPGFSAIELEAVRAEITRETQAADKRQRRFTYVKELLFVGVAILVIGAALMAVSRIDADVYRSTLGIAMEESPKRRESSGEIKPPIPQETFESRVAQLDLLDLHSSPEAVVDRMSQAELNWSTMWQDISLNFFGPPGYIGPSDSVRIQVWLDKPDQVKMIAGPAGRRAEYRFLGRDKGFHHATMDSILRWYYLTFDRHLALGTTIDYLSLPISQLQGADRRLVIQGTEVVANRQTLVVDQVTENGRLESRMWVDRLTGVVLRKRLYAQSDPSVVVMDAITNSVYYDVAFPANTFEPGFNAGATPSARRYLGATRAQGPVQTRDRITFPMTVWAPRAYREPFQSFASPPAGFDPAGSRLAFQYLPNYEPWRAQYSHPEEYSELFAGDYYLGSLHTGDPYTAICDRSPDGELLALAQGRTDQQRAETQLSWIRLAQPKDVNTIDLDVDLAYFAFAPDNRRLALFGFGKPLGALYILDTQSSQLTKLLNIEYVRSLMWSPDGEQLAIIGNWESPEYDEEVMVVDSHTGRVLTSTPYNYRGDSAVPDLPDWISEKSFLAWMGSLDACAAPPQSQTALKIPLDSRPSDPNSPVMR